MSVLTDESNVAAACEHLSSKLGDGTVILDMKTGTYFGLDPVGARVWELVQQGKSFSAVCELIVAEFDVRPEVCRQDLRDLITQMHAQGLVQITL